MKMFLAILMTMNFLALSAKADQTSMHMSRNMIDAVLKSTLDDSILTFTVSIRSVHVDISRNTVVVEFINQADPSICSAVPYIVVWDGLGRITGAYPNLEAIAACK